MSDSGWLRPKNWARLIAGLVSHGFCAYLVGLTLYLVGQPLYANDTWIHLALGEAFAEFGPWLETDPHLFTALGPPGPASWLGSVMTYGLWKLAGFTGLRVFHVLIVGLILFLAWRLVRSVSSSAALASLGLICFITLSTYRLVQLRPELFTFAFVLFTCQWLVLRREPPTRGQIVASFLIGIAWSNIHAAFLLGPVLVLGVAASLAVLTVVPGLERRSLEWARARGLALAGGAMALGGVLNPRGLGAYWVYFEAGGETPGLEAIVDEWGPTQLFSLPIPELPPSLAAWVICWVGVLALVGGVIRIVLDRRGAERSPASPSIAELDPGLFALGVAGLVATLQASRFLWLMIFSVAVLASLLAGAFARDEASCLEADQPDTDSPGHWRARRRFVGAIAVILAVPSFAWLHLSSGDWPMVSKEIVGGFDYRQPYRATKYYAHAVWFLKDAGLQGRVYNDYGLGGFMSFWLSPGLKMSASGTMNIGRESMEALFAVQSRHPAQEGQSYTETLDELGIDIFLAIGLPKAGRPGQPVASTVRHLENESGWMLVFRNLRSAVYVRRNEANANNLRRVAEYYASVGVPFDLEKGFQQARVISRSAEWSTVHGLIPADFAELVTSVRNTRAQSTLDSSIHRLSMVYASLGLYELAAQLDESILRLDRRDAYAARRLIWNLMQLGRFEDALGMARKIEAGPLGDDVGTGWSDSVEAVQALGETNERARTVALLPLLDYTDAAIVQSGVVAPVARLTRN